MGVGGFSGLIKDFARKMTEGIADCMPLALRSVGDAIRLDSQKRTKVWLCNRKVILGCSSLFNTEFQKLQKAHLLLDLKRTKMQYFLI